MITCFMLYRCIIDADNIHRRVIYLETGCLLSISLIYVYSSLLFS